MQRVKSALIATAGAGALFAILGATPAVAGPIFYTFDPSATVAGGTCVSSCVLSSPTPSSPQFTGDDLTIKDYSAINLTGTPFVTETAILVVTDVGGFSSPGFVNGTGNSGGILPVASPYELYFYVTANSTITPDGSGGFKGNITALTYTLYGDQGGNCTFSVVGTTPTANCGGDKQLSLVTGNLASGPNQVTIGSDGVPTATDINTTIVAGANGGGFWVAPLPLLKFNFQSSFTNTTTHTDDTIPNWIIINGGGGDVGLIGVPEPGDGGHVWVRPARYGLVRAAPRQEILIT